MDRQLKQAARGLGSGFGMAEVLVVLALAGLMVALAAGAWNRLAARTATMQAARLVQQTIYHARMLSVYRGINHFVVLDPGTKTIRLYQDSSVPLGELDPGDRRLAEEPWPPAVALALPAGAATLPNPWGGPALADAWSAPAPHGAAWGHGLLGVMATPWGAIAGCATEPVTIETGVIVFSDTSGLAAAVGIRGRLGWVQWFHLEGSEWRTG